MTQENKMIQYDLNKKSMGVAYLLFLFLGGFGTHRYYTGNTFSGLLQLILLISSIVLACMWTPFCAIPWLAWVIWMIADLFLTARNVKKRNIMIAKSLGLFG